MEFIFSSKPKENNTIKLELNPCEKNIHDSKENSICIHNTHLKNIKEKCFSCDNHVYSPHLKNSFFDYNIFSLKTKEYIQSNSFFSSQKSIYQNNKSPPILS